MGAGVRLGFGASEGSAHRDTGAACARGRRRGNAESRGGEVDEGAPAAGATSTRHERAPGAGAETRSGGGGRRARACGQASEGTGSSGSRTPAARFCLSDTWAGPVNAGV